jgi:hypothetical protein
MDKRSNTFHETPETTHFQTVKTPWPNICDTEFCVSGKRSAKPEILKQAISNSAGFKTSYLECREALQVCSLSFTQINFLGENCKRR